VWHAASACDIVMALSLENTVFIDHWHHVLEEHFLPFLQGMCVDFVKKSFFFKQNRA
jgi:hypothetical protein